MVLDDERLTYGDLRDDSGRLARLLGEVGVGRGDRVALLVPKAPAAMVAMDATLRVGGAYVPVDLASPPERVAMIVRSAEPRAVLCTAAAATLVDALVHSGALRRTPIIALDAAWPEQSAARPLAGEREWRHLPEDPFDVGGDADDLAHILFTSGSTGVPKGVPITHGMVCAFIEWAVGHFGTGPADRISGHPPLHFDLSTFDIYGTFAAGAELHLVPPHANVLPGALAQFIRDRGLTQWFSVPSTLAFMVGAGAVRKDDFPTLERVLFCGEPMPTSVLAKWMRLVPRARYTNLYGPTETTIASTFHDVATPPAEETRPVPIGVPCAGELIRVQGRDGEQAAPNEVGEIHIAGVGLSPGYWRDPARTREAFVTEARDPQRRLYRTGDLGWLDEEGVLHFAGRADSQIKHRGYRIELGEVETALSAVEGIRECAVVAIPTAGFEQNAICCAYSSTFADVDPAALRAAAARTLPTYMLPSRWWVTDALPKNQNGKIDRGALREHFMRTATPSVQPA